MKNSFAAAAALDKHCIAANAVNCVRHLFGGALKALVAVAALALAGPAQSAPVIHEVVDGIEWTYYIVNGSAVIFNNDDSVIPKSTSGAITVPSTIGGYTVTGIGRDAFFECDKLTSVTVPDTVTSVDGYAFYRCTNLKTVELPLTVTHVGSGIFDFCTSLENVTLPAAALGSTSSLFSDSTDRSSKLNIKSVTVTAESAVMKVERSKYGKVTVGWGIASNGTTIIPAIDTNRTGKITVPATANFFGTECPVVELAHGAFGQCAKITGVTMPGTVKHIGGGAFSHCSKLAEVTMPEQLETIGDLAFWACTSLSKVILGDNVRTIGTGAFQGCTNLYIFTFGANTRDLGERIFSGCTKLGIVNFRNPSSGVLVDIPKWTFRNCSGLGYINLPDNVRSLGEEAFKGCMTLATVSLPGKYFASYSDFSPYFSGCPDEMQIVIRQDGSYQKTFYRGYFWTYKILTAALDGHQYVKLIDPSYGACVSPNPTGELKVPAHLGGYRTGYPVEEIGLYAFKNCTGITKATIPSSVTAIGADAFYGCTGLTELSLPDGLRSIGEYSFYGCNKLKSLTVPDTVGSIGKGAFEDCTKLETVTLPMGIKASRDLGEDAFSNCTVLTTVFAPGSLYGSINVDKVFANHNDYFTLIYRYDGYLSQVVNGQIWNFTIDGDEAEIVEMGNAVGAMTVPRFLGGCNVTSIGNGAFSGSELTSIVIPASGYVTSIGANAFQGCRELTSATISDNVESIGVDAFNGCTALESVTLPARLTKVANGTFFGCSSLDTVYADNALNLEEIEPYAFFNCLNLSGDDISEIIYCATTIDESAFAFSDLVSRSGSLYVRDSVTSIGDYAFGYSAFEDGVSLPGALFGVVDESKVFYGCPSTMSISYRFDEGVYAARFGDALWRYTLDGADNATLVGVTVTSTSRYTGSLPSVLDGHPVVAVAPGAFENNDRLRYITIPGCIATIGDNAFKCSAHANDTLGSLTIEDGVTTIGANAFAYTLGGQKLYVPDSVTAIGAGAFARCYYLTRISLPGAFFKNLDESSVFANGSAKLVVTYRLAGGDVMSQKVGDYTWYFKTSEGGSGVTICSVGKGLTSIGVSPAPSGELVIPSKLGGMTVNTIGSYAFRDCSDMTSVAIPDTVTKIEAYAFYCCPNLDNVEIPRSVTTLEDYAFRNCVRLKAASLPDTLNGVIDENNVFDGCHDGLTVSYRSVSGRTSANVGGYTWYYRVVDGGAEIFFSDPYASPGDPDYSPDDWHAAVQPNPTGPLVIPETLGGKPVTKIGKYAFNYCDAMTAVTIPYTVTEIGELAFSVCDSLATVNFGTGLKSIGRAAFNACGALANLDLPNGLTSIGVNAFANCSSITSLVIPDSLDKLGAVAFQSCTGLTSVTLPDSLTDIGNSVFSGCSSLTDVTLKTQAAVDSFMRVFDRSYVKNVTIAEGVTAIGDQAFCYNRYDEDYWVALESVTLPESLESIGAYAFRWSKLKNLTIPDAVKSIGEYAFANCKSIASVAIPAQLTGDSVGEYAFYSCNGLTSVTFEEGATVIGAAKMFVACNGITSVVIPDGVMSIAPETFYYCEGLATLTIPQSVTSIGEKAFRGAPLATVHVAARDTARVKAMLVASGFDQAFVDGITFVEELPDFWFVGFDANGGFASASMYNVAPGAALGELPTATRTGYDHAGWYTAAEGGSKITSATKASADVTYYAHWTPKKYVVEFDSGDGSAVAPIEVVHGMTIGDVLSELPVPTRDGYAFKGWVDADGKPVDTEAPVTDGFTVYATWAKIIEIELWHDKDGVVDATSWGKKTGVVAGDPLDLGETALVGWVFLGWSYEPDGEIMPADTVIVPDESLDTLYSQFTLDAWTVTFDAQGGDSTVSRARVAKGSSVGELPGASRYGYTFDGWYTAAEGGSKVASSTKPSADVTYYAHWTKNAEPLSKWVVTFDANGGSVDPETVIVDDGSKIGALLPTPSRSGWTFEGWVTADDAAVTVDTVVTADFTCYALWRENAAPTPVWTVTFDANGGSCDVASVEVEDGHPVGSLPVASRDGYTLKGWFTAKSGGDKVTTGKVVTEDATFYAQWTKNAANTYTVAFDANGGSTGGAAPARNVAEGAAVGELPSATRTGYTFKDWWTAVEGGYSVDATTKIYADTTFYAHWQPNMYTVLFDANGGEVAPSEMDVIYDSAYTTGGFPDAYMTGWTFEGWFTAAEGGEQVLPTDIVKFTGTQTLYAHWSGGIVPPPVEKWWTVTWNPNGGDMGTQSATQQVGDGESIGTLHWASRDGWLFNGWFTAAEGGMSVTESTKVTADVTYYAHWTTVLPTFTIVDGVLTAVELNGAKEVVIPDGVTAIADGVFQGQSITSVTIPDSVTSIGENAFLGTDITALRIPDSVTEIGSGAFCNCEDLREVEIGAGLATIPDYAFYNDIGLETVTIPSTVTDIAWSAFQYNEALYPGYSGSVTVNVEHGDTERVKGMMEGSNFPITYVEAPATYWVVTFDGNGGDSEETTRKVSLGAAVGALPAATREGYTLKGWYTAASGGSKVSASVKVTEDVTYYAQWTENQVGPTYRTVTFDANGGTADEDFRIVLDGKAVGALPGATRSGYTLKGWFTAKSGGTKLATSTKITKDVTYYAQWTKNTEPAVTYTVTFNPNGGNMPAAQTTREVEDGASVGELPVPTRTGYTFKGWFTAAEGGTQVKATTKIDSDVMFFAQWTSGAPAKYTVFFDGNGGEADYDAVSVPANSAIGELPDAVRDGYTLKGWFTAKSGGTQVTVSTKITKDVTFYAQWTKNSEPEDQSVDVEFEKAALEGKEGDVVKIVVKGGSKAKPTVAQLYLTYNSAVAADIDLKTAQLNGSTPKGGLKFPVSLYWPKGDTSVKTVTIPLKVDKAVEVDEIFTLQIAGVVGDKAGAQSVCTVTIKDPSYAELAKRISGGTATKADVTAWNKLLNSVCYIRGLGDPADGGKVTGSNFCPNGKKVSLKAAPAKNYYLEGWYNEKGVRVATTPTLVIDRTTRPAANTANSTTLLNITEASTFFARFNPSAPAVTVVVESTDGTGAAPSGKGAGKYVAGNITGAGRYAQGKKKVTLKATSNKGYVFNGWYDEKGALITQLASYVIAEMGAKDVQLTAKYVTAAEDLNSITLKVGDKTPTAGKLLAWSIRCGVAVDWPVASGALSATTVKASGLPSGLKLVQDKATKAYSVTGAPKAASKELPGGFVPSNVKFTVTTAGKSKQEFQVAMTVLPVHAWAAGTFNGAVFGPNTTKTVGIVQAMTVGANGKVSGKLLANGVTWTLAATSFSKYSGANKTADEDGTYVADVTLKSGRDVVSMPVTFSWVEVKSGNLKCKCGVASSDEFSAFQNLWKRADTKAAAPVFKKAIDAFLPNTLALQFKKDGVVSFAGNLTGAKISGTSQLIPNGDGNWAAVLHVPPKNGVPGYNELVDVKLTVDALNVVTAVEVAPAK